MKVIAQRRHVTRPGDYESVELLSRVEIDLASEEDAEFRDMSDKEIGAELSARMDDLLDTDVRRTLRLDGQHINDSHLWTFYRYDDTQED